MLNVRLNRDPLSRAARTGALLLVGTVALTAVSLSREAIAQPGVGSVSATLYDQAGGLLPAVAVSAAHVDTGRTYQAATDSSGAFMLRSVPSGVYEVTMSLPGFSTVRATIDLHPGDSLQRNIVLPLGTIEETITIVGPSSPGAATPGAPTQKPRSARTIPTARASNSGPGSIGGNIKPPTKLMNVNPVFPSELGSSSATVTLSGRIGMDGFLVDLKDVSQTQPHPAFVASLLTAAYQWEFNPTYLNGAPVETNIRITGRFTVR